MGGYDLAVGIDEDRGRKDAVAGHVHEAHLRVKHHRAGRYPAREQVIGNGLPVLALVGEEYGNIGICRDVSKHGKLPPARRTPGRSEEHTSELQSLMRISYAVFCLKKKKYNNEHIESRLYRSRQMDKISRNNID